MNDFVYFNHADADSIKVESDECGFELHVTTTDGERHVFNIHGVAVDLLAEVERTLAPWHREGMSVLREMQRVGAFECGDPEGEWVKDQMREAYDISDPKHPDFHSTH